MTAHQSQAEVRDVQAALEHIKDAAGPTEPIASKPGAGSLARRDASPPKVPQAKKNGLDAFGI